MHSCRYCVVCLFALFHMLMLYFLYRFSYNKILNEPLQLHLWSNLSTVTLKVQYVSYVNLHVRYKHVCMKIPNLEYVFCAGQNVNIVAPSVAIYFARQLNNVERNARCLKYFPAQSNINLGEHFTPFHNLT